jgi:uracil-DNA glycosylase family 4
MIKATGPENARIMIVGDIPNSTDILRGRPFSESNGHELASMLHEAGILMTECRLTLLIKTPVMNGRADSIFDFTKKKPIGSAVPDAIEVLKEEIKACKPNIVILLGGLPLYAAIGDSAISTWRGSLLDITSLGGAKAIPTYAPSQIRVNWEWRGIAVNDLRRVLKQSGTPALPPSRNLFEIRPSLPSSLGRIGALLNNAQNSPQPYYLSVDLETRAGHIACIGIAWNRYEAISIPLMCVENLEGYFNEAEEFEVIIAIRSLLIHPNVRIIGQNFLYDSQYFAKHYGYVPNIADDTMFMQHILFPGLPKGLDFLASMYCEDYTYWKSEGKLWNPKIPEEQLWVYNCKDACYTYEVWEALRGAIPKAGLSDQYAFQMKLFHSVLRMMMRGLRIDTHLRAKLGGDLLNEIQKRQSDIQVITGSPLNEKSPTQMRRYFYDDLRLPVQRSRKGSRGITTDDEALEKLSRIEPLVAPLCNRIRELRSLGVFLSTFVRAKLDHDLRMRCSFNPTGTETYRFNSSKDAFDTGTNLQNVPAGDEDEDHDATSLVLPNIRKLFIPDPEYLIFDVDLAGADAQVVAWEAEDDLLKAIFRSGEKLHAVNAKDMFGGDAGPDGKKMPYYAYAKAGCHLTNYGGKARTLAIATGMSVHQSESFQRRWFDIHPGIKEWHERTENQLSTRRYVENKFGYRRFYYDRIENLLPQALAWIPQSTVACVTNRQLQAVEERLGEIQLLIQVHDSLVAQALKSHWWRLKPLLREALQVVVPYDDPLIIQSGLKTSGKSWGDAEAERWDSSV